jgi:hypothetical protein
MTPAAKVRSLPKGVWIAAILVLPVIGAGLWYWLGMPAATPRTQAPARGQGPDDDAEFLRQLNIRRQQQKRADELARREQELKRREAEFGRNDQTPSKDRPTQRGQHDDDAASGQDGAGA